MGGVNNIRTVPMLAGEDLSGDLYKFCVINNTGRVVVNTTAQGSVDGIISEEVDAAGKETSMVLPDGGIAYIKLAATLAAGALVASDNAGLAVAAGSTAGNIAWGRLKQGGDAGDIVQMSFGLKAIDAGS